MNSLSTRIKQANKLLKPYAVKHGGGLGREHNEPIDATRFPFQRDRDRILHTQAFRRLKHKTQVFVSGHGDHYRTRITHTLEVAQISRDIARTLGLNEDLAESIALAHDLGHTPFGHAGEQALDACMSAFGECFEHNEQSLRIVTKLERRTKKYRGLNLSKEILEGLMKHRTPHDNPKSQKIPRAPSLEAQVVNLADEIAYTAHDTDDGMRAGKISVAKLRKTKLGNLAITRAKRRGTEIRGALVELLVSDLYASVPKLLRRHNIRTLSDVYRAEQPLVEFSSSLQKSLDALRKFLWENFYMSRGVRAQANEGMRVITKLFAWYITKPPKKVLEFKAKHRSSIEEAVKDYIAGMTDGFAQESVKNI